MEHKIILWAFLAITSCKLLHAENPDVEPEYLDMLRSTGQHEEFARHLGLENVNFVFPRKEENSDDPMFNKAIPLGDILLTKEQVEQGRQAINSEEHPTSRWPDGIIPYYIRRSDFGENDLKRIEKAIDNLNSLNTRLFLRPWQSGDKDYCYVFSGEGCYSNLGRIGGPQSVSLQKDGCLRQGTIQHEFIHASGFTHEQNRSDRDEYIKILWENIPEDWRPQYKKGSMPHYVIIEPYDYYSVMHYGMTAPGTSKPAFQVLKSGVDERWIGQRQGLTRTDVNKIRGYYS